MEKPASLADKSPPSTAGLPRWPRWRLDGDGRSCTVSGRHLTPGRARAAWATASLSTLALLVFPGWYCWGFRNIPPPWWEAVKVAGAKLGFYSMTYAQRKWVFVGLWAGCWLLWRAWEGLFYAAYRAALVTRTTVEFTAERITFYRQRFFGLRPLRINRTPGVSVNFSMAPHPDLPLLEAKARGMAQAGGRWSAFYQQIRFVYVEYGQSAWPVARFLTPQRAQPFVAICQFANAYPLKRKPPPSPPQAGGVRASAVNAPDV